MASATAPDQLEQLLDYLKGNRGFDFTGYKRPSLARRVDKRVQTLNLGGYAEYQDYLEVHPEEFEILFNTILINVTAFFRDDTAWDYLAKEVLPALLARRSEGSIRVWSAGCASGEEAYTLAIVLSELLGADAFRDRVKIYATDVDEEALSKGRLGVYSEAEVADIPERLRKEYFEHNDGSYAFRRDLRRQVVFGRHDLVNDAPISRVDLLVCRNTLMYLNAETQARILARFHFALNDGGILFLGRAETLLTQATTFEPIDLKRRISTKVPRGNLGMRDRLLLLAQNGGDDGAGAAVHSRLRELATDTLHVPHIVVDAAGQLAHANERARLLFGLGPSDMGRALSDLKISYRPADLRTMIEQARANHRPMVVREVEWQQSAGGARIVDVHVSPITEAGAYAGASIAFADITAQKRMQRDLEVARQELETATEELQSTNEELETTNEELQSTVEELETTNEELQSTNEELETMNEELQSTNEELTAINDELRRRTDELGDVNLFLQSILANIEGGVVVVNPELLIVAWSRKAQDLWGLREDEVTGKHLLGLDIGLPVGELRAPLKKILAPGEHEPVVLELQATNRRGKSITCRVSISHLRDPQGRMRGAILLMEESAKVPA
jgi:two-component system CheB/CheR fusion protein